MLASVAQADIAIQCSLGNNQEVVLATSDKYYFTDSSEDFAKKHKTVTPVNETEDSLEVLIDFGSDYEKMSYVFTGLKNCGIYDGDAEVVDLQKSLKSFNGKTRLPHNYKCTCVED